MSMAKQLLLAAAFGGLGSALLERCQVCADSSATLKIRRHGCHGFRYYRLTALLAESLEEGLKVATKAPRWTDFWQWPGSSVKRGRLRQRSKAFSLRWRTSLLSLRRTRNISCCGGGGRCKVLSCVARWSVVWTGAVG
uniref:RxLR effector candidate protein n=1 Tax=Hyaloperonospora arabidopsidis (strain Emoy2) TaxID=559515 RepID=M4B8L1_HYAAE